MLSNPGDIGSVNSNWILKCQSIDIVILDSTLMDMSNDINSILKANERKDVNQLKLNEKIREKENNYLIGDMPFSPQKKIAFLYNTNSYKEFLKKLSELKQQGSIFAMSLSASDISVTVQNLSNQEITIDISHQDVVLRDLDLNNQLHNEVFCQRGESQWSLAYKAYEKSGNFSKSKRSETLFTGKLGSSRVILSNSTFNRICKRP